MANEEKIESPALAFEEFIDRKPELTVLTDHPLSVDQIEGTFAEDPFNFRYKLGPVFDILRSPGTKTPMSILISGDWGSGKTSAMRWLECMLKGWNNKIDKHEAKKAEAIDKEPVKVQPVWFYPWKYDNKEDVRRGLIASVIINAVYITNPEDKKITLTNKKILTGLKLLASFGINVITDLISASEYGIPGVPGLKMNGRALKEIRKHFREAAHPEAAFLNELEEAMKYWVKESLGKNQRMVIFIDDLDRCMPEIGLQVLEALKLYLNIPNLIFVVGVDKEVVEKLVIEHYSELGLVSTEETGKSETQDQNDSERKKDEAKAVQYLSKMFQVEVHLEPTERQISGFFDKQLVEIPYWSDALSKQDQELFRKLVLGFAGRNPREIKRLLNSALIKGSASVLIKKDGIKFNQGLQLFFVRKILDERYTMASEAGSKRGIEFFTQWSIIVRQGREKDEKFPITVTVPDEFGKKPQTELDIEEKTQRRLDNLFASFAPDEYHDLLKNQRFSSLFHLLADDDLGRLMQIEFPPEEQAEEIAAIIGKSKDADIVQEAVARQLDKNLDEVVEEDYKQINFLNFSGTGIIDLNILTKITEIKQLDLSDTSVSNLLPLEALKNLQTLKLTNTHVEDIEPLRSLKKLERLNMAGTLIDNIRALASLENLKLLGLADTKVYDLAPIKDLKKLSWLDIRDTQVSDLEPIAGLSSLRSLFISGSKISSLEHLFKLKELLVISISTYQYKDLSFLANLPSLSDIALVGGIVDDLTGIQEGQKLTNVEFTDTNVSDLQPLRELPHLRTLTFTRTPISDFELLKELTNLEILNLFGTDLTDHQVVELQKALPKLKIVR